MSRDAPGHASRAGLKLERALRAFDVDPAGAVCIDFGSHAGGFVECLLRAGAAKVYAVDPGYGVLDDALRTDERVVVCERTNALDFRAPQPADLITIDVGWTPQRLILPAARRCLKPEGKVISLVKPQYEAPQALLRNGVVPEAELEAVLEPCRSDVEDLDWTVLATERSPLTGHGGNAEFLWLLAPRT